MKSMLTPEERQAAFERAKTYPPGNGFTWIADREVAHPPTAAELLQKQPELIAKG